jgi:putative inorganic carbon (hco3(-)) transporter
VTEAAAAAPRTDRAQLRALLVFGTLAAGATAVVLTNRAVTSAVTAEMAPLLIVAGMIVGALTLRYSAAGASVLIAFIFLNLSEALVRYANFPSLLQLLVVALAFAAWLRRDTDRVESVLAQPITIAVAAWLLFALTATTWARDHYIADSRMIDLLKAAVLFALATLLMRTRRRIVEGVRVIVISTALIGAVVAFQMATGRYEDEFFGLARLKSQAHLAGDIFQARAAGPIGDPNFFAQVLLIPFPLAAVLAFTVRSRARQTFWSLTALLTFVALAFTYSRGALVALPVMAVMLVRLLRIRWKTAAVIAAAFVLLVLLIVPGVVLERLSTLAEILPGEEPLVRGDSSFEERRTFMRVALAMLKDQPLLGVGTGNYGVRYEDYSGRTSSEVRQWDDLSEMHYAHNFFLEAAAENGIIGLLLVVLMLGACWTTLRRSEIAFAAMDDPQMSRLAGAFRIALTGFMITSLFLHLALPRHLLLIFAFAASLERLAQRKQTTPERFAVEVKEA